MTIVHFESSDFLKLVIDEMGAISQPPCGTAATPS
jgi:hypothetical protein